MTPKQERLQHANKLITVIAAHGRRFFYDTTHDRVARLELDRRGRVWFVDDYSGKRIYTHYTVFGNRWKGFSHGGTLRHLVELMRDYVVHGTRIYQEYIAPTRFLGGRNDIWGYGEAACAAVRAAALSLPIIRGEGHG